jgi:hypothetical protein
MLWEISLILVCALGFYIGRRVNAPKKKTSHEQNTEEITPEQKYALEQEKRENENFESYIGRVQPGHKDYK